MRIVHYKDSAGEFRWRAVAENGRVVADSGEGYKNASDALEMATELFPDATHENEEREQVDELEGMTDE